MEDEREHAGSKDKGAEHVAEDRGGVNGRVGEWDSPDVPSQLGGERGGAWVLEELVAGNLPLDGGLKRQLHKKVIVLVGTLEELGGGVGLNDEAVEADAVHRIVKDKVDGSN